MLYERETTNSEVNPNAYMPIQQGEQGGIAHLVHGWIQRGNSDKVFCSLQTQKITNFINRVFTYQVISHTAAPQRLRQGHTAI